MVKVTHSVWAAQGFAGSDPGCRHGTAHQATQMPQLEGPTTKKHTTMYHRALREKGKNKIFLKKSHNVSEKVKGRIKLK